MTKDDFFQKLVEAHRLKVNRMKEVERLFSKKPICLFGYGNKGRVLAKQLRANNVDFIVFDSNTVKRQEAVADGFEITNELCGTDYCYVLGSGQYQVEQQVAVRQHYIYYHECTYFFDLPHVQDSTRLVSDIILERQEEFFEIFQIVKPYYKNTLLGVLLFRASLNPIYLQPIRSNVNNMWIDIPGNDYARKYRCLCDVGAYDGDTIALFASALDIESAIAIEANAEFTGRIIDNSSALINGVEIVPYAAWSTPTKLSFKVDHNGMFSVVADDRGDIAANSLDNLVKSRVDVLKLDIEGSELEALNGAANLIQKCEPDIFVAAYHRPSDFYELTNYILEVVDKGHYELCVRHYSDVFDDTIFYFMNVNV